MDFLVFVLVVFALVGLSRALRRYLRRRSWQQLGRALGFSYAPPERALDWRSPGTLSGARDGAQITVTTEERNMSRFSTTWTRVTFDHPAPLGLGLTIAPQGLLSTLAIAVGGEDLETGAAEFDGDFRIRARDTEGALRALNPDARSALTALAEHKGQLQITDASVCLAREGLHADLDWIQAFLDDAQAASRALVSAANAHTLDAQAGAQAQAWG